MIEEESKGGSEEKKLYLVRKMHQNILLFEEKL